jgi:Tol biopolymer transport system component
MNPQLRDQLARLLKAGDKAQARTLLINAIRQNPRDDWTWLAMAHIVDDEAQKRECLTRALAINPANPQARQLMDRLPPVIPAPASPPQSLTPSLAPEPPAPTPVIVETPAPIAPVEQPKQPTRPQPLEPVKRPAIPLWVWLASALGVLCLVGLAVGGLWLARGFIAAPVQPTAPTRLAATVAAPIATLTDSFPTFPPTWTATPVTPTATPLPTFTPIPSAVAQAASRPDALTHKIAYTSYDGTNNHIYVTDGTSQGIEIAGVGGSNISPVWLGGGKGLWFLGDAGTGQPALYAANVDGSDPRPLFTDFSPYSGPLPSPDGDHLAFVTVEQRELRLEVIATDGSDRQVLLKTPFVDASMAVGDWSPDGGQIVFTQTACTTQGASPDEKLCDSEVFVINADGNDLQQLTQDVKGAARPRWSPDGKRILFYNAAPDEATPYWSSLMVMDADGGNPHQLALDGFAEINLEVPDWSPDGQYVAFRAFSGQGAGLYVLPVACFSSPKPCSWDDVARLPFDAAQVSDLIWKNGPPVVENADTPAPIIPLVTPIIPTPTPP